MRITRYNLLLIFTLFVTASNVFASEKPLSTNLLDQFVVAFEDIKALGVEDPKDSEQESNFWYIEDNGKKLAEYLRSAPAAGKIKSIAKSHGFANVEELTSVLSRFFSATIVVQLENNPEMRLDKKQMEEAKKAQDQIRAQMLASGMPEAIVETQMQEMENFGSMWLEMEQLAKQASAEDIKFARQNLDYMEKIFPEDEDDDQFMEEEVEENLMGD